MSLVGQTLIYLVLAREAGPASAIVVSLGAVNDAVVRSLLQAREVCFARGVIAGAGFASG